MPALIWTEDAVRKAAASYTYLKDFREQCPGAYDRACDLGLLDSLGLVKLKRNTITFIDVQTAAAQCKTRTEFCRRFGSEYGYALKQGLLDAICTHMPVPLRWSDDDLTSIAIQYQSRKEFQVRHPRAYHSAHKRGLLDSICSHMPIRGDRKRRIIYRIWHDESRTVYVGLSYNWQKRYRQHVDFPMGHLAELLATSHQVEPLTEFLDVESAARAEAEFVAKFKAEGWTVLNRKAAGNLGSKSRLWTKEDVLAIARKCRSRGQFQYRHNKAYQAARRLGLDMDEVFADHDGKGWVKPDTWTKDGVKEVAARFALRTDMSRNAKGAYLAAVRRGWLDEVFADHPNQGRLPNRAPHGTWQSKEAVIAEAKKYTRRSDFMRQSSGAYDAARDNGWLDECFPP